MTDETTGKGEQDRAGRDMTDLIGVGGGIKNVTQPSRTGIKSAGGEGTSESMHASAKFSNEGDSDGRFRETELDGQNQRKRSRRDVPSDNERSASNASFTALDLQGRSMLQSLRQQLHDNAPLQQSFPNFSALQQSAQGTSLQQQPFYLIGNPAPANVFAGVVTPQPVALVVDPSMLQNLSLQIQGLPQAAFGQPLLPTGTLMIGGINQMTCLSPLFLPVPRSSPPVDSGNSNLLLLQHALAGVSPIFSTSGLQEANIQSIGLAQDCNPAIVGQLSMNQATYNSPRGTFVVDLATSNTNTGPYAAQRIISEAAGLSHQALQIHEDSGQYSDHVPGFTLYMKCDDENISRYQCLVRQQIELFAASEEDIDSNAQGRNKPIVLGQVGIRCRHCSKIPPRHRTRGATYYPAKLTGLYQAAQNMASAHLCNHCQHIPDALRRNLIALRDRKSSAGGGKQYWADGVRVLGVIESDGVLLLGLSRHIGDMSNEPSDADKQTVKEKHKNPARESDA